MPLLVYRMVDWTNHILISTGNIRNVFQHLGNRLAANGDAVAVQESGHQQGFHNLRNTPSFMEVHRKIFSAGFQVAKHGCFDTDPLEVIDAPLHICSMRDGQQMQDRIGRAANGHNHCDRIFKRSAGDDVARLQVAFNGFDQHFGRLFRRDHFFVVRIGHGGRIGQGHAQRLKGRGHGVGGVHAATRPGARNGMTLYFQQFGIAHLACGVLADGLEDADNVEVLSLVAARKNGASVNIDGRHVGAQHSHHAAGHILVAAANHNHTVHPLALHASLDAVGNYFAANQRIFHAFGTHRHAVRDRGRAENLRVAASFFNALNRCIGQFLQAAIAWCDGAVPVCHADHRFAEIVLGVAHRVVHGAIRSA